MANENYYLDDLTKEDIQTMLECLLFSASVDLCSSWYLENINNMVELSKKIRKKFPDIILENVYLVDTSLENDMDKHTNTLVKYFPELEQNTKELSEINL
jgi:hypothetical protein